VPSPSLIARAAALAGVCAVVAATGTASAAPARPAVTPLPDSVAAVTATAPGAGAVAGSQRRTIEVWLAGRERSAQRFVDAVSTPGAPGYRRFVSPTAYTERFGPRRAQVGAVRSFLRGEGFTRVRASVDDDYVSATAPVSTIDDAFSVRLRRYRVGADTIQSNDRELSVPASIAGDILAVTGLNTGDAPADDATAHAARKGPACSAYWAQKTKTFSPAYDGLTEAAVPVCGYSAKQMRAAYGLTGADTGRGKTIALVQAVGGAENMFRTLTDYAKRNGLPAPRPDQYREEAIGQGLDNRSCFDTGTDEAALDSEEAYAMAPGADQLMVNTNDCVSTTKDIAQDSFDAKLAPLTGNGTHASAAIESASNFLRLSERLPASEVKVSHAIALRAAAEGVSMLNASDDTPGVGSPASDPDITAVGGTTLGVGAQNQRLFETGWSTDFGVRAGTSGPWHDSGIEFGAGGGASVLYRQPGYQKGVVPVALSRNSEGHAGRAVPDIAADADPASGMLDGQIITHKNGTTSRYMPFLTGGTSMAAPLVAGIVADAEQGTRKDLGFLNPLLYSLAGSTAFRDILPVDPTTPQVDRAAYQPGSFRIGDKFATGTEVRVIDAQDRPGTTQVTAPGYDTMTGLGTPNGAAFIKGLRSAKAGR
jgi:subtilase family serine protease